MAKGRIGLDIGSTAVRAVELVGSPLAVVRASQIALPPGAVESGEVRDPAAVSEALRRLWDEGGFKGRQVWLGVGQPAGGRPRDLAAVPAREGAPRLPRVPGAGVHPDAGRRGGARLPRDRRVRARGPPDAPDAPRGSPAQHGRLRGRRRARREARATRVGSDPVRARAFRRGLRRRAGSRAGPGRRGDRRHRRARHEHRRARSAGDEVRPDPPERWARHHGGDREDFRRRGRGRRTLEARPRGRERAEAPRGAAGRRCSAPRPSSTRCVPRSSSTRPRRRRRGSGASRSPAAVRGWKGSST